MTVLTPEEAGELDSWGEDMSRETMELVYDELTVLVHGGGRDASSRYDDKFTRASTPATRAYSDCWDCNERPLHVSAFVYCGSGGSRPLDYVFECCQHWWDRLTDRQIPHGDYGELHDILERRRVDWADGYWDCKHWDWNQYNVFPDGRYFEVYVVHGNGCMNSSEPEMVVCCGGGDRRDGDGSGNLATSLYFKRCDGSWRNALGRLLHGYGKVPTWEDWIGEGDFERLFR